LRIFKKRNLKKFTLIALRLNVVRLVVFL